MKKINFALMAGLLVSFPALVFGYNAQVEIYNAQNESFFGTTTTLVSSCNESDPELILFDGQFSTKEGNVVLQMIKDSGKRLKQIVITCGDPDYYFGLEPIVEAYPDVEILSSARVAEHIRQTKDDKLQYWGPKLNDTAPKKLYEPQNINQTTFTVGNTTIEMRSSDNHSAYLWIPGSRVIFGGVGIFWNVHVFVADTQTKEDRESWRQVLREMLQLKPDVVIPGHFFGELPERGEDAISFTLKYLEDFEQVLEENVFKDSTAVIEAMKQKYPDLGQLASLELSAKVNTGEMEF